ncbi:MAG: carbon monoxide dehydrogenase subunit G [Chloroflexi bacterium]|nr:carbon monoxide dehydrogenase subunit G [Chloroflexota bacterium]
MKLSGSYRFDVPREQLWDTLMDPEVVKSCIPGVREFTALAPDNYQVEVKVGVGVVTGTYIGTLELSDKDGPASYRMTVEGKGARTAVKGTGTISLVEAGEATELNFEGEALVTGMLARVGQRLMGSVAKANINQFFECIESHLAGRRTG